MKRPLLLFAAFLCLGIVLSYFINSFLFSFLSIFLLFGLMMMIKSRYKLKTFLIVGVILFYSIGTLEYTFLVYGNERKFIQFADKLVVVTGHVSAEPEIKGQKVNYLIRTEQISQDNASKRIKGKVLLSTPITDYGKVFQYGQKLEIRGKINIPEQERNPGGFDYRKYLATSGISATMFVRDYNIDRLQGDEKALIVEKGFMLRKRVIALVNDSLPGEQAGLLNGMLIGYRDGLNRNVQNAFSDAGLTHIMAVSGANIAFIIFPLVFLFKKLRLKQGLSNILIIAVLIIFVFITGFSPSVVRAVIMAIVILLAQILRRETDIYTSIAIAAILLLIYNPYVLFDVGFQLSFGATISLVLFYAPIKKRLSYKFIPAFLGDLLAVTLAAQIGVLPLTAYYFNKISIISLVSNILVVPLTGIITILGFVMVILGQLSQLLSQVVGFINNTLLTSILYVVKISSELPFAIFKVVTPSLLVILLYYASILFLFWYKPKYKPELKIKPIFYAVVIVGLFGMININSLIPSNLDVVFVDVGQGDCTFIKSSTGKTVLIDGGGSETKSDDDNNIGETTVMPYLYDSGVSKIDMVIATHGHNDHVQGLIPILKEMNVGKLVIPDSPMDNELNRITNLAKSRNIPIYRCVEGDSIQLDSETCLDVIHPSKGFKIDKSSSNNSSLVLKLTYKKISMLFTGDIEKEVEDILVQNKLDIQADVLKVAHHGSPYSTTEGLLDSIKPKVAVISVGKNNFGHPDEAVLKRMRERDIKIYRTDESGAIFLESNGEKITVKKTIGE